MRLPTTNILQRTFYAKFGENTGTCFTIDVDNHQYIVTAQHTLKRNNNPNQIDIRIDKKWCPCPIKLVGHSKEEIDISVFAADVQISPSHPLKAGQAGLALAQEVYFLGFPHSIQLKHEIFEEINEQFYEINRGCPIPFVKKGIVSLMSHKDYIMLDGHNNSGFSGGPVVCYIENEITVIGVISGYHNEDQPVYGIGEQKEQLIGQCKTNSGIIYASNIQHVLDLIKNNPIGAKITQ